MLPMSYWTTWYLTGQIAWIERGRRVRVSTKTAMLVSCKALQLKGKMPMFTWSAWNGWVCFVTCCHTDVTGREDWNNRNLFKLPNKIDSFQCSPVRWDRITHDSSVPESCNCDNLWQRNHRTEWIMLWFLRRSRFINRYAFCDTQSMNQKHLYRNQCNAMHNNLHYCSKV